jgi:hypothetical protein
MTIIMVMMASGKYKLVYAPQVRGHVAALEGKNQRLLRVAIEQQLAHEPLALSRNRKPLVRLPGPEGATWELRCGPENRLRVFYEVDAAAGEVRILAIGLKERARVFIGGEEVET